MLLWPGVCCPGQAIRFDNGPPDRAQRIGLLVELGRVLIQIAIAERCKVFGRAELVVLASTIGAARQRLREGARPRPDTQTLHSFWQKSLLVRAARLLEKLLDSSLIALDQPLLKGRHHAFRINYPIETM